MTENQITTKLVAQMRAVMTGAVIFKHADRSTVGIPDISCTWRNKIVWPEVKYLRPKDLRYGTVRFRAADVFLGKEKAVQLENMRRLQRQATKAIYLIYTNSDVIVIEPEYAWELSMSGEVVPIPRYTWSVEGASNREKLFVFPRIDKQILELLNFYFEDDGTK